MIDKDLDRLIRSVDPCPPDLVARLDGAEQELLAEITAEPRLTVVPSRRGTVRRFAAVAAAAAVVAGVVATAVLVRGQPEEPWAGPVGLAGVSGGGGGAELDRKAAEGHPRLLIDQPGWTVTTVDGFAEESGSITFTDGTHEISMDWYPAGLHQSYYLDRLGVSAPERVRLTNWPADVFTYSADDFAAMLRPRDGAFVELRTGRPWTRAGFDEMLTHVVRVGADDFLAALPPHVVTPGRVREAAARILADVPLPPGFDVDALDVPGANDPYQFGARVTGMVGCGWIAEWIRADRAGERPAVKRAAAALRSSHRWRVLHDMNGVGDYPEVLWEIADEVADGDVPDGYTRSLDCDR